MSQDFTLRIDSSSCIGCKRCVQICTSRIFYVDPKVEDGKESKQILLQDQALCIRCGQCVSVCPSASIFHSDFPAKKIHPIDVSLLPSSEQVMELIKSRRSNRAFSAEKVPEEMLDLMIEAAHRAPSASNAQTVKMVLITRPELITDLSWCTLRVFSSLIKKLEKPWIKPILKPFAKEPYKLLPKFKKMEERMHQGQDYILRDAKAVLLFYTPKNNRFGCQDANLAYQNASLMAQSLGVAHFYTGFVCAAFKQKPKAFFETLGVEGQLQAGMAIGMPSFTFQSYMDKEEVNLKRM